MDTVKIQKAGIKMIVHRGLSGLEPENDCAAFADADAHRLTADSLE